MEPAGFPETSVTICQSTLRNISEEPESFLHRNGSLKSKRLLDTFFNHSDLIKSEMV